jgi:hypothetical protein
MPTMRLTSLAVLNRFVGLRHAGQQRFRQGCQMSLVFYIFYTLVILFARGELCL